MAQNVNKFGLTRTIPKPTKDYVRTKCGFGCVVCGAVPYQYDHFRVGWADAEKHDPEDIILLCDNHHSQKTKRQIDNDWIARAMARAPMDRPARFKLPGTNPEFKVRWPGNDIEATVQGIVIDGRPVLKLEYQPDELEPVVVSGAFRGLDNRLLCVIDRNEIIAVPSAVGDFSTQANRFLIKDIKRRTALHFELSNRGLEILAITHASNGSLVVGNENGIWVCNGADTVYFKGMRAVGCERAIDVRSRWVRDYEAFDITAAEGMSHFIDIGVDGGGNLGTTGIAV